MRINKLTLMKPVVAINIDAELIEDKILPLNKAGKLNVIKCMFANMRTLAKVVGYTRIDIANAINAILNGDSVNLNLLSRRYVVGLFDEKKSILTTASQMWAGGIGGHTMVTFDNATGDLELCGLPEGYSVINLRGDDIDVLGADRVPHNIPVDYCDYSDTQLLQVINHLFINLRALATTLESSRYDITVVLDAIAENYTDPAVEMTIADIGSIAHFTKLDFMGYRTHVVLDRRDNNFYLYITEITYPNYYDANHLTDDHLDMPIETRLGVTPVVPPSRKLIDRYKKKPSRYVEYME